MTKKIYSLVIALATVAIFTACEDEGVLRNPDGVLINGVTWATSNVDLPGTFAENPEDAGRFYQWNISQTAWSTTNPLSGWRSTGLVSTWNTTTPTTADHRWDGTNPCPEGWRVPTRSELRRLADASNTWTTVNGVPGRRFGSGNNTIFIPASGFRGRADGALDEVGVSGFIWSSTQGGYSGVDAFGLSFDSDGARVTFRDHFPGFNIRCVAE